MSFTPREARRIIRKAVGRVPEGEEIRHLNIMPMMDMMTILLVAFIAQAATSATELNARSVTLPPTLSDEELPDDATTLVITKSGIVASIGKESKSLVQISNGQVECSAKDGGCLGRKINPLTQFLSAVRTELMSKPTFDKNKPLELMLIADRTTPYQVLVEVMYSAKQKEAGFNRFRLIVQKSFPPAAK